MGMYDYEDPSFQNANQLKGIKMITLSIRNVEET